MTTSLPDMKREPLLHDSQKYISIIFATNWNLTQLEQHILLFESVLPFSETGDRFNSCCFFSRWY